jgi:hypothetical protein
MVRGPFVEEIDAARAHATTTNADKAANPAERWIAASVLPESDGQNV